MQSPLAQAALLQFGNIAYPTREDGQDLLEYGLLAALIALVALGAVSTLGHTIYNVFWKSIADAF